MKVFDFSTIAHFGLFSIFPTKVPISLSYLSYILSKAQNFMIPLMYALNYIDSTQFIGKHICQFFIYLFLPAQRFDFHTASLEPTALFVIFQIYTYLSLVFAIYLLVQAYERKPSRSYIHSTWCYICYLHVWFLGFMICSFNLHIVKTYLRDEDMMLAAGNLQDGSVFGLAMFSLCWNAILTLLLCFLFSHSLKTRDMLSLKTKYVLGLDFIQEMILYSIVLFMEEGTSRNWIFVILSLTTSGLRLHLTYEYLALYKLKMLFFEISINTIGTCLSFFSFLSIIFDKAEEKFVLFAFMLFTPLVLKLAWSHLKTIILKIMTNRKGLNPYHIIHIHYLYKTLLDKRIPSRVDTYLLNYEELFFLGDGTNYKIIDVNEQFNFDRNDHFKSFGRALLKSLIQKNLSLNILKISYVYQIYKYFDAYLEMIALIHELRKKKIPYGEEIDLLMIYKQVDSKLHKLARDRALESNLDMYKYIKVNEAYKKFRIQVLRQAELQIRFWDLYVQANTDFLSLVELSRKIEKQKVYIKKFWRKVDKFHEKNFTTAYLAYSLYLEVMNNRPSQSSAFINQNSYILNRMHTEVDELTNETLYEKETSRIIVSASKDDMGTIMSCSRSIEEIIGYITQEIVGTNIKGIMPTFYRERHDGYLGNYFEYGIATIMDKTRSLFALNSKGFLTPILLHVKLDPYITTQTSFIGLMRPLRENSEFILVRSSGQIDSMTYGIASSLNFDVRFIDFPMFKIWPEFRSILTVYNKYSLRKAEKRRRDYYKVAIDDQEYNELMEKEKELIIRKKSSFLTGIPTVLPSTNEVSRPARSAADIKSLHELDSNIGTMTSTGYLWRKINKLNHITQDELKKTIKEYGEIGQHVQFRNIEKGNYVNCFIQITSDIHDDAWIIIIRVRDIETETNDESKNSSQLELELRQERIEREKRRSTVIKTQNEIANHLLVGEDHMSSSGSLNMSKNLQSNGSHPKLAKGTLNDIPDRPKTRTYLDMVKESRGAFSSPDLNASHNIMNSDRELSDHRDKLLEDYVIIPEKNETKVDPNQLSQKKPVKDFKKIVSKTKRLMDLLASKKDKGKLQTTYNGEHNIANKVLKKFVFLKEGDANLDKQDTSSVGSVQSFARVNMMIENAIQSPFREIKHIIFFWLYFMVIILINIIIIIQTLHVRSFNIRMQDKNNAILNTYQRMDDMGNLNWAVQQNYAVYKGYLGTTGIDYYDLFLEQTRVEVFEILSSNKKLNHYIQLQEKYIQDWYHYSTLKFYELTSNDLATSEYQMLNTFDATTNILQSALTVLEEKAPTNKAAFAMRRILTNSVNDYLLTSQTLLTLMKADISNQFDENRVATNLYAIIAFIVLSLFFLGTLFMLFQVNQSSFNFANLFLKLPKEDAEFSEGQVTRFVQAINEDFQNIDHLGDPVDASRHKIRKMLVKVKPKGNRQDLNLTKFYMSNFFLIVKIWPILFILAIIVYLDTMNSLNTMDSIKFLQNQVDQAASFMYTTDLSVAGILLLIMSNGTGSLLGNPVLTELTKLNLITSEVKKFTDTYQRPDGTYGSLESQYLFGVSCNSSFFETEENQAFCNSLSTQVTIGLLDINLILYKDISQFIEDFISSDRSLAQIQIFFFRQFDRISPIGIFQNMFTTKLLDLAQQRLETTISDDNQLLITIAIAVSVVNVLLSTLAIPMVLMQLLNRDNLMKKLFRLVPIHIIVKNRWLKFYLVRTSGKLSESVKRAL